jgi:hypothetical protein
MRCSSLICTKT